MEFGRFPGKSGKFREIHGNSVGFRMALSMNSVGIPGGFRGNAGFLGKDLGFGVVSGDLGGQKVFCAKSKPNTVCTAIITKKCMLTILPTDRWSGLGSQVSPPGSSMRSKIALTERPAVFHTRIQDELSARNKQKET